MFFSILKILTDKCNKTVERQIRTIVYKISASLRNKWRLHKYCVNAYATNGLVFCAATH